MDPTEQTPIDIHQKTIKRLQKLELRIRERRKWLDSAITKQVEILPSVAMWNPQSTYQGSIFLDDLDMVIIQSIDQKLAEPPAPLVSDDPSVLKSSIIQASKSIANLSLYGWALVKTDHLLVACQDLPCVPISQNVASMRSAARSACNALAKRTPNGHIPNYIAIYSSKMKRLAAYRVDSKFCNSHYLANEANLTCAGKKISRLALLDAPSACIKVANDE